VPGRSERPSAPGYGTTSEDSRTPPAAWSGSWRMVGTIHPGSTLRVSSLQEGGSQGRAGNSGHDWAGEWAGDNAGPKQVEVESEGGSPGSSGSRPGNYIPPRSHQTSRHTKMAGAKGMTWWAMVSGKRARRRGKRNRITGEGRRADPIEQSWQLPSQLGQPPAAPEPEHGPDRSARPAGPGTGRKS